MKVKQNILLIFGLMFLGLQFFIIIQPGKFFDDSKSWPFLRYPMFAHVMYPGDDLIMMKLIVTNCKSTTESIEVDYRDLHVMRKRFNTLLRKIHSSLNEKSELYIAASEKLSELISKHLPGHCSVKILYKKYPVTETGLEIKNFQWEIYINGT